MLMPAIFEGFGDKNKGRSCNQKLAIKTHTSMFF
jgi:hypothetical protein